MAPKTSLSYALIAPCIPLPKNGREAYTYHVSEKEQELVPGSVVRIPFGKRTVFGIVIQRGIKRPLYPTKPISSAQGIVLSSAQMEYAKWIATVAHGGIGFTLRMFLP